jgi:hypothetical protein
VEKKHEYQRCKKKEARGEKMQENTCTTRMREKRGG